MVGMHIGTWPFLIKVHDIFIIICRFFYAKRLRSTFQQSTPLGSLGYYTVKEGGDRTTITPTNNFPRMHLNSSASLLRSLHLRQLHILTNLNSRMCLDASGSHPSVLWCPILDPFIYPCWPISKKATPGESRVRPAPLLYHPSITPHQPCPWC